MLAAVAAPLTLAAVLIPFRGSFPNTDAALAMLAVVVAVAANGHRLAGVLAALSAAAWFDFFLTQAYERLTNTRRADIETTVLLLVPTRSAPRSPPGTRSASSYADCR